MRMTVTLDEDLLEEAKSVLGKKTKKEVIEEALRELVRKKRRGILGNSRDTILNS